MASGSESRRSRGDSVSSKAQKDLDSLESSGHVWRWSTFESCHACADDRGVGAKTWRMPDSDRPPTRLNLIEAWMLVLERARAEHSR